MTGIDFPSNPGINQQFSAFGNVWIWNGSSWRKVSRTAVVGAQGNTGQTGPQGLTGAGAQGAAGPTGAQGNAGGSGPAGAQGAVGSQGAAGAQGNQGAVGAQGSQGTQGNIGVGSITTSTGAPSSPNQGDLWWDTDDGVLLVYYNDGNSSQWVSINTGVRGAQGATGSTGSQGATGPTGAQGAAGSATLSNNADNRVITGGSGTNLNGEANLTYDGNNLSQSIDAAAEGIQITGSGAHYGEIKIDSNRTGANQHLGTIKGAWNGTQVARIDFNSGYDTSNKDDGQILFDTSSSGGTLLNRVRITSGGNVAIGGNASPQQLLHVWPDTANTTSAYVRVTSGDRGSGTGIDLGSDADGDNVTLSWLWNKNGSPSSFVNLSLIHI